jgi:hypothetical protein
MSIISRVFHFSPLVVLFVAVITVAAGTPQAIRAEQSSISELEVIDQNEWPREIITNRGTIVMYQPEPERLDKNMLRVRAAVGVERPEKETVFGVVWIEARLETDREERTAVIADLDVTDMRFPDQTEDQVKTLSDLLESEIPKWNLSIEMDDLIATLELADTLSESTQQINVDPPAILFYPEPAVLITIDGEPRLADSEEKNVQRVTNTPYTILYDTGTKAYYLFADEDSWYTSPSIKGDWKPADRVPGKVAKQAPAIEADRETEEDQDDAGEPGPKPRIVVATEPTELISSKGHPEYEAIEGTSLYYISNTDSDLLFDSTEQTYYVLLSGRWYTSLSLDGPWQFKPGSDLPEQFSKIEEDSEIGTVLYAVPGTTVANEAVMDARIPQTAAIDRQKASLNVDYDGEPQFQKITGTRMHWAANTATPVIRVANTYYAVDEGVWFVANSAQGPWAVATTVPEEIYTIPADSPVYNVTFVRIYEVEDEVVYTGYTPGYTNTYVYNNTIVYGTGYYWPGWYGRYYYPRYGTWGYHVRWNPWVGWGFGFSYGYGPYAFPIGVGLWFRGGWWGAGRYAGYRRGYRHGYRHGYRRGVRAGYRAGQRRPHTQNVYKSNRNQARTAPGSSAGRANAKPRGASNRAQAGGASGRSNNVYSDRNGNVYRQTNQGWQQRSGDSWRSTEGRQSTAQQSSRQQSQPSSQQRSGQYRGNSDLNRSANARQHGNQRSSYYRQSAGARRGGGRRR